MKKTICLDFDGVVHSCTSGWKGPRTIPDPPVDGALKWMLRALEQGYDVCVLSSRSRYFGGRWAMRRWLEKHAGASGIQWTEEGMSTGLEFVRFVKHKPSALIYIDDRGYRFNGTWPDLYEVTGLVPWNKTAVTVGLRKAAKEAGIR